MRQKLTTHKGVELAIVVKRVKGRLYVYDQAKVNGEVVTKYIGPLEEMARLYQMVKHEVVNHASVVNYRLTPRLLRRLAKAIAEEVVNSLKDKQNKPNNPPSSWWARGDSNPGPPPCEGGCEGGEGGFSEGRVNYSGVRPPLDNSLLSGFSEWLVGRVSPATAEYYVAVVSRGEWPPRKRKHVIAWRNYVKYLASASVIDPLTKMGYLDTLSVGGRARTRYAAAVKVETIRQYRDKLVRADLEHVYLFLLGGTRLSHTYRMLASWSPDEVVEQPTGELEQRLYCSDSFCRYYLGIKEGSKRVDYVYFPTTEPGPLSLSYRQLKDKLRKLGVQAKLFRKFANQRMIDLAFRNNIRVDAVNLIMSRELTVTGAHYLVTRKWADLLFSIYTKWLKEVGLIA